MNRVQEQCPKIDSGIVQSQIGSKQAECTECTTCWPNCTPGCAPRVLLPLPLARAPAPEPQRLPALPSARLRLASSPEPACRAPPACVSCLASAQMGSSPFQVLHFFFSSFPVASLLLHTCSFLNTTISTLNNFMSSL